MIRVLMVAMALAMSWSAHAAGSSGTVTILEGNALVYRGAGSARGVEGLRVTRGDIIETSSSSFAQIEFSDQSIIQFGPDTRVMMIGGTERQKPERWLYLMEGWVKVSAAKPATGTGPAIELRSPLIDVPASSAVVVMRHSPSEVGLFVERGELRLAERQASGPNVAVPLKAGDFYTRKQGWRGTVTHKVPTEFVTEMPRDFRDSLPSRLERFRDRQVQPMEAPGFTYADVERWLKAEPSVRRPLMQRWRGKAREPAFRAALITNLSAHPEWDPVLFPEKYRPKEPSRAAWTSRSASSAASSSTR